MSDLSLFKWRQFQADIILCAVRWYLRYALSDRDVEELLRERGVWVEYTTVFRWVQRYAPELDKRCQPSLRATNDAYHVDETYLAWVRRVRLRLKALVRSSSFIGPPACSDWVRSVDRV